MTNWILLYLTNWTVIRGRVGTCKKWWIRENSNSERSRKYATLEGFNGKSWCWTKCWIIFKKEKIKPLSANKFAFGIINVSMWIIRSRIEQTRLNQKTDFFSDIPRFKDWKFENIPLFNEKPYRRLSSRDFSILGLKLIFWHWEINSFSFEVFLTVVLFEFWIGTWSNKEGSF